MSNIAFSIIVFNSDFVLKQAIESVYPYASQILISEGCVGYWKSRGFTTSTDRTNEIIHGFPDPDNKITITHGTYPEKTEQCNAVIPYMRADTDWLWNLDADEVFKPKDIEIVAKLLQSGQFTSAGFKSYSFYGGFDRYLGGFEEAHEFIRIRKVYPGSYWSTHRPPTIAHKVSNTWPEKHLSSELLSGTFGVRMYHYSYVFPRQVREKVAYYKAAVSKENCIDNYFETIYMPWVLGDDAAKTSIENTHNGVHEFKPHVRGECRTKPFVGEHPDVIRSAMPAMIEQFNEQMKDCRNV